jgi:hypothetical protein
VKVAVALAEAGPEGVDASPDDASDEVLVAVVSGDDVASSGEATVSVAVAVISSVAEGVTVSVCVADGVGVTVDVLPTGDGVAVVVAIACVWVAVGSTGDGVFVGKTGGLDVDVGGGGGVVGPGSGVVGPGVGVGVGTV